MNAPLMIKNLYKRPSTKRLLHKGPLTEGLFSRIRDHRRHTDSEGPLY